MAEPRFEPRKPNIRACAPHNCIILPQKMKPELSFMTSILQIKYSKLTKLMAKYLLKCEVWETFNFYF